MNASGLSGNALQPHLQDAGGGQEQGDEDHGDRHQPEGPHLHHLRLVAVGLAAAHDRHGIGDHGHHHHHIGAIEGHVAVSGGDLVPWV
jgi:hypothetical protein